jgi:two-component system response regulator FixJ
MSDGLTIAVLEDDDAVRDSLGRLLEAKGYKVESYPTVAALRAELREGRYRVALFDVRLPDGNGVDFMREALDVDDRTAIVVMTAHGDVQLAVSAMKAGAVDFLEKPFAPTALFEAVARAEAVSASKEGAHLMRRSAKAALTRLTPRELEVLHDLVDGATSKEIARRLDLSPRTVESHRASIMAKTGADSLPALVRLTAVAEDPSGEA